MVVSHSIRDTAGRLIGFRMPLILMNEEDQVRRRRECSHIYTHLCLEQDNLSAVLSADPSVGDGYTVALIQYPYGIIVFTRSGDEKWFELRVPNLIKNMVFHKGKLYTYSVVYFCELEHDEKPRFRVVDRALHGNEKVHYLFETPRGDLLSIWRERNNNSGKTISVLVYRLMTDEEEDQEEEERPPEFRLAKMMDVIDFIFCLDNRAVSLDKEAMQREEAKDLEDLIVFLSDRNPICLSPCDFPAVHLMPNSLYFTDDDYDDGNSEFSERNWFIKILNCPADKKTIVRLYWQPPSTSLH